jgi:hypothetical protein
VSLVFISLICLLLMCNVRVVMCGVLVCMLLLLLCVCVCVCVSLFVGLFVFICV